MKVCTKCGESKRVSEFYRQAVGRGGRDSRCKKCVREYQANRPPCVFKGCERPQHSLDHCQGHAHQRRLGQELRPLKVLDGSGWNQSHGYRAMRRDGRVVLQHRYVIEQKLGRRLLPDESVHHINGVRDDNRIENLELWSTSQPTGQRVKDKVAWAREIIALYG